ncbi:MAG: MarC family protein [Chlamydiales bacterium]|nr:MarC family protein [Chlamydiales bacterium]
MNSYGNFFGITVTLFLVIDSLGNIPTYLSLIKPYNKAQRRYIALRELLIALGIMIIFHYFGQILLSLLGVSATTVQIAGGLILFLIAIRLIFSNDEERPKWEEQKLLIFPIATPLIAGPSVLAAIMIFAQDEPSALIVLGATCVAWLLSSLILFFAQPIHHLLKDKGLLACQRLMGLIVAIIAVQLFLEGVEGIIK